jgi:hypothetical protein
LERHTIDLRGGMLAGPVVRFGAANMQEQKVIVPFTIALVLKK